MIRLLCSLVLSLALCTPAIAAESNALRDYWQAELAKAETGIKAGGFPGKVLAAYRTKVQALDSLGRSQEALDVLDAKLKGGMEPDERMPFLVTRAVVLGSLGRVDEARRQLAEVDSALLDNPLSALDVEFQKRHVEIGLSMRVRDFAGAHRQSAELFTTLTAQSKQFGDLFGADLFDVVDQGYHFVLQQAALRKDRAVLGERFAPLQRDAETLARKYVKKGVYLALLDMYAGKLNDKQIAAIEPLCTQQETAGEALNCQAEVSYFAGVWNLESGNKAAAKSWFKHGLDLEAYGTSEWAWLKQEYAALQ